MSAFPLNFAHYDTFREPLTLGGKAAILEHLTPHRDPQQALQAQQAASDALHAAFQGDSLDSPHQKGGV